HVAVRGGEGEVVGGVVYRAGAAGGSRPAPSSTALTSVPPPGATPRRSSAGRYHGSRPAGCGTSPSPAATTTTSTSIRSTHPSSSTTALGILEEVRLAGLIRLT